MHACKFLAARRPESFFFRKFVGKSIQNWKIFGKFFFQTSCLILIKVNREIWKKRREHFSIIASILEFANDGALKTKIMYDAKLSYTQLENYVSLLIKLRLLETSTRGKLIVYKTTEKGIDFIKRYAELHDLLSK